MRHRSFWKWSLRLGLVMLPAALCWARQASPDAATPASQDASAAPVPEVAEAVAMPVSSERPAPGSVRTDGAVGDLIKLVNAGVDSSVLMAFATNSVSAFGLNAAEVLYLKDLGVPTAVVIAVLQHDQALQGEPESATPAPPEPAATFQYPPELPTPPPTTTDVATAPGLAPSANPPDGAPPAADNYLPPPDTGGPGFYDALAPYGNWLQVDGVGLCWQPSAAVLDSTWQPYVDAGQWLYTDYGWYWASAYSWGWAPFHYGRWFRHNRWGWCWAPDKLWGPSWVSWRYNNGYCGWAPLPPGAVYQPGSGLNFYGRSVGAGFDFGLGFQSFAFVPWMDFNEPHLRSWAVRGQRAERVYVQSAPVTRFQTDDGRTVSNTGLSADHVASATHTRVRTVAIRSLTAPTGAGMRAEHLDLDGSTVGVFRPSPAELGPIPEPVSFEPGMAVVRSPAAVGPGVRTFGQSQPVPLDRAERLRALAGVRLSTPITRPRVTTIRADPGWLSPHARGLQGPALPVAREAVAESAAAPVEVPRYSSPAERTRIASGPMRTESTHVRSAPVVSAPERSSSSSWQNAGGQSRGR